MVQWIYVNESLIYKIFRTKCESIVFKRKLDFVTGADGKSYGKFHRISIRS